MEFFAGGAQWRWRKVTSPTAAFIELGPENDSKT